VACRLLVLNERDPLHPQAGGAEVHVAEIAERLGRRGFETTLLACGFPGAKLRERVGALDVERLGPVPVYYGRVAMRCWRATREGRFDVVIEHLNKLPFFSPWLSRRPVLAVCHHLFGTTAFEQVAWPIAATVVAAERMIPLAYARTPFIAVSESTRHDLVSRGISDARISVIHNGIRSGGADAPAPSQRGPRIAYFGRLEAYKRVDLLLRAVAALAARMPSVTLDVIGRGTDGARLERLAAQLGIAGRTRFHGFVDDATRDALLARARVCVCPSVKEGWGITVIEANSLGVPVVATDAPGLRDAVQHDKTGFLVSESDPQVWAGRIQALLEDDALADRLGSAARAWAREFDWDLAADRFEDAIRSIVGRG
jgi:glycosyltransferase involved in cell wall biosynthesis